jgi:protein ImuB
MACVDVPELPLQMLLRKHPSYRDAPAALVAEERPEAPLLCLNRHARAMRLHTGMRFGAAKSLVPELCAGAISALEVEECVAGLVKDLQTFSPHVERDPVSAGVFYVDPTGLSQLYGGELSWARCVQRYLSGRSYFAAVVVAHGRALSYALVRITRGVRVMGTSHDALAAASSVPLERLHVTPKLRDGLARLGLTTLGDLTSFGADQLAVRFGAEAARWCRVARGEEVLPLMAEPHADTPRTEIEVDPPDSDVARLCFTIKRGLDTLLEDVRQRGLSVRALWLKLKLERAPFDTHAEPRALPESIQRLEPSAPTRDATLLLELLRLRLTALVIGSNVASVVLEAETGERGDGQLQMFTPKRDLAAGARALARLRASFGAGAVCKAVLEDAHLPEARFRWADVHELVRPTVAEADGQAVAPLVRRMFVRPEPLAGQLDDHSRLDKVFVHDGERLGLVGPYRVSGGWWAREVTRDYYYARTSRGELWWVFYDHPRKAWFLHAVVD